MSLLTTAAANYPIFSLPHKLTTDMHFQHLNQDQRLACSSEIQLIHMYLATRQWLQMWVTTDKITKVQLRFLYAVASEGI